MTNTLSIRRAFAARFGKAEARRIEAAAKQHANGTNSENKGADHFKWALLICIGYECMSKNEYRKSHGITTPWRDLKAWIKKSAELGTHTGDFDYLALFSGAYDEFAQKPSKAKGGTL